MCLKKGQLALFPTEKETVQLWQSQVKYAIKTGEI
jgi:hypothetical protein